MTCAVNAGGDGSGHEWTLRAKSGNLVSRPLNVFETEAERYDRWFDRHPAAYESELEAVRAAVPLTRGRSLEIGAGTGRFALPLRITDGVEPAAAMRRIAENRGVHVADGVAEALPFDDESFDCALMVTTICFVDNPRRSCREAWRVLRPGGRFVVGFVDLNSPLGRTYETRRDQSAFYRDARFFAAVEVEKLLRAAGFENLQCRQTLFRHPDDITSPEPVLPGHGRGGFVVVAGRKPHGPSP
jgi:SAM-dependent methyltransferase